MNSYSKERLLSCGQGLSRAAYCDVDGTLADTDIVKPLVWVKSRLLRPPARWCWLAGLAWRGPWWLFLDKINRGISNRSIYAQYAGIPVAGSREWAELFYRERIRPRLFPGALARLAEFQKEGVRIVFVTGGLDLFMAPLAEEFGADCLAAGLDERDGVFTGLLKKGPLTGSRKSGLMREHARRCGIDLKRSFALGDAVGDLAMLEAVGFPIAVNPDRRLVKIAAERGWPTERWKH